MPNVRRNVKVREKQKTSRLPDSLVEGGMVVEHLHSQGVLQQVGRLLRVTRQGGYLGVDIFLFIVLFFSDRSRDGGGLAGFSARCQPIRCLLGALGERQTLATSTSASRFLNAVPSGGQEPVKDFLLLEACGGRELLLKRSVLARDGLGFGWDIFDLDPTSMVLRQRALPDREDMPKAQRRAREARPGYTGRKRGDVKVTRTTLQHAGSGLWLGIWVAPGNGDFPHHRRLAFARVKAVCQSLRRDTSHVLIRMDGEGGRTPCISDCMEQGLHYLARSSAYSLLSRPEIQNHLNEVTWYEVEDSGSGPIRYAAEMGRLLLPCSETSQREDGTPYAPVMSRLVVSRYRAEVKHGAGLLLEDWKYELYATDLDAQAYVASEVVTLYYSRSAEENRFKQEDRELNLDRALSYHLPGYELVCAIGLFLWNLWICWGVKLFNTEEVQPEQLARRLVECHVEVKLPLAAATGRAVSQPRISGGELHGEIGQADVCVAQEGWDEATAAEDAGQTTGDETEAARTSSQEVPGSSEARLDSPNEQPPQAPMMAAPAVDASEANGDDDVSELLELVGLEDREPGAEPLSTTQGAPPAWPGQRLSRHFEEHSQQKLTDALAGLDWTHLRQHAQGWRFSPDEGGIKCSYGHLLTLRSVKGFPDRNRGALRFRALPGGCPACPGRASCNRPTSRSSAKEVWLFVGGGEARRMEALLARARGRSPSTEATPSERIPPTQELTLTEIEPNSPTAKMVLAEEGSMECSQVLPGPQGREENARRMLTDALAGLDWTHLRQYAQGWRFSPDDGGIRCSYGHLLTLRCVQLSASGSRGSLRFIALPRGCAGCPGRSTCIRPTSSVTAREVRLVVSGQEATHIKTLLARTRPGPSSSEVPSDAGIDPSQRDRTTRASRPAQALAWEPPGPLPSRALLKPVLGSLQPAAARHRFHDACRNIDFYVELNTVAVPPRPSRLYVPTPESRQHRRLSWTRREQRNALPRGSIVELDIQCPAGYGCALYSAPQLDRRCL